MRIHQNVILATVLPGVASAWHLFTGWSGGDSPTLDDTSAPLFSTAISQANTSASVPIPISGGHFNLQVNVTTLPIPGADVPETDPAAVFTLYAITWPGDTNLNATVNALGADPFPQLSTTYSRALFSAEVTNGYDFDDEGSCVGPLGKKCVDAITSAVDDAIPDECQGKFPDDVGFFYRTSIITDTIITDTPQFSPAGFLFHSEAATIGSPEETAAFERAVGRLHMVIFKDIHGLSPVCLRIKDEHVSKADPSTGGAGRVKGGGLATMWALYGAFMLLLMSFYMP